MDFFASQARARRNTRIAVVLFLLATVAIVLAVLAVYGLIGASMAAPDRPVALPDMQWIHGHLRQLGQLAGVTLGLIVMGSAFKILTLREGGGAIARSLGGTRVDMDTPDLARRRLVNVVTEMAIAAGVSVPEIYVMEGDLGINAFAAGFSTSDAAIGVTQGTVERLTRDELQGVIAHEFSHILNGDMTLNIRMVGVLNGILLIGLIGQYILRFSAWGRTGIGVRRQRGRGGAVAAVLVVGALIMLVGYVGLFFARLIKAAAARQREYLADASAVQFTRNPAGIAGALKKIGGFAEGSRVRSAGAEEVSHMFFGAHRSFWAGWMSTHPPLVERIRAIEPRFQAEELDRIAAAGPRSEFGPIEAGLAAGLAGDGEGRIAVTPESIAADVGNPTPAHLRYAATLLASLPDPVREAAADPAAAEALCYAVILGGDRAGRRLEVEAMRRLLAPELVDRTAVLWRAIRELGPGVRLPLVDLAFAALKRRPVEELRAFVSNAEALVRADDHVDLFEYALLILLKQHFADASDPKGSLRTGSRLSLQRLRPEAGRVLSAMARVGEHGSDDGIAVAFRRGVDALLGSSQSLDLAPELPTVEVLDADLERLDRLPEPGKRQLVGALATTLSHDGAVNHREAELLRAVCERLHCPLPPLAAAVGPLGERSSR